MARKRNVTVRMDPELHDQIEAYAASRGRASTADACRELLAWGLYCKAERAHASVVGRVVSERLESFEGRLSEEMEYRALEVMDEVGQLAAEWLEDAARCSRAAMAAACEAASAATGEPADVIAARCVEAAGDRLPGGE